MAVRKPLVIVNGQVERLQPGDRLDLSRSVTKNNNTGNTLVAGTPVIVNGGNAVKAQANSQSNAKVAGFVAEDAADASPVEVQTEGILTLTTTAWDNVTGQTGGLTEGATYYLSALAAGMLTTVSPDDHGDYVVGLGRALSTTEFEIEVGAPIKL